MQKNTAGQRFFVKAFDDNGAVSGDAANITCQLSIDGAAYSATNDVNPTEIGTSGQYVFDLTQAETNGYELSFVPESSTSGVQVMGMPTNVIYTSEPLDLAAIAQAVTDRISGVQLTFQQQAQLSSEKRLSVVQGDDYSRNPIRIDIDVAGEIDGDTDLTQTVLVVSFERWGSPFGFRIPIEGSEGDYYAMFSASYTQTRWLPVGHHEALFRIEYEANELFTIGEGWFSVLGQTIDRSDLTTVDDYVDL